MGNAEVNILLGEIIQDDKLELCGFSVTTEVPAVCIHGEGVEGEWRRGGN